jgi:tRNA pseudouridine55 synthase
MNPKREITGIFLLDKDSGFSSNAVLQRVKRLWQATKAGHTGSLDPLASGMLPICFGQASKLVRFLLEANKLYQVKIALGQTTATGDSEGELLLTRAIPHLSLEALEIILEGFRGPIEQIPPNYSALKQDGQRFYELARQGRAAEIKKKIRKQHIYSLVLDSFDGKFLSLTVRCDKGTYIRTLAEDIGEKIGCGAHVVELRRVFVEPFENYPMYKMEKLNDLSLESLDALLLAPELAIPHIPKVSVNEKQRTDLYQGKTIEASETPVGWVQLWAKEPEQLFGIGEVLASGLIVSRRLFKIV